MARQKVGIYCRISREKKTVDKSIEDQKLLGIKFAKDNELDYELYIDEGYTGVTDKRPQFLRLYSDVLKNQIELVWVFDEGRLQRNNQIRFDLYSRFKEFGVQLYDHLKGHIDLHNAEVQLQGGILAEMNQYYVMITSEKIRSVLTRRVNSGKGWGLPPFGYTYDKEGYYVLHQKESIIVKRIYNLSLNGSGTEKIAGILNTENIPTRFNSYTGEVTLHKRNLNRDSKVINRKDFKWAGNTVRGILNNSMFYGLKTIKDKSFEVDALFSYDYWQRVNFNLKSKNRNTKSVGGTKKYEYLLNGVITCGKCGSNYNGKTRQDKKDHFYYCMSKRRSLNCGNRSINIDKIESFIWRCLFSSSYLKNAISEYHDENANYSRLISKAAELNTALELLNSQVSNLVSSIKMGVLRPKEAEPELVKLRPEIEALREKIELIEKRNIALSNNIDDWQHNGIKTIYYFKEKVEIITKFIEKIIVHWVEKRVDGQLIRYYLIEIKYKIGDLNQFFTNGVGLNMDQWFSIEKDKASGKAMFKHEFWLKRPPNSFNLDVQFLEEQEFYSISIPEHLQQTDGDLSGIYTKKELLELQDRIRKSSELFS